MRLLNVWVLKGWLTIFFVSDVKMSSQMADKKEVYMCEDMEV